VTDTVGFIEKLPHQLVEAFKATLEETVLAELLLHVVDASSSEDEMAVQMKAADEVLEEIGAGSKPRLLVLNKVDLLDEDARAEVRIRMPEAVLVSAVTGEGLDDLKGRVDRTFEETMSPVELFVPYSQGARLHDLHEVAGRIDREDEAEGVRVRTRLPEGELHRFADLAVTSA
jgi:GTP-binding protein HflX